MTKKKECTLKDWAEVNSAIKRMGEIDIEIGKTEGNMTLQTNEIKAKADEAVKPLLGEKKKLEEQITLFAEENKVDFIDKRSKDMTFGRIAYRLTTKIMVKSKEACIKALETLGLKDCLKIEKKLDKDEMAKLDDKTLLKIGAWKKPEDKLRIEPNIDKIKEIV